MDTNLSDKGMRLLKKGKRGFFRVVFSRLGIFVVLLLIQLFIPIALANWFGQYLPHYFSINLAFIVGMVLYLLNSGFDPTAKITWLILIMLAPLFGAFMLLYTRTDFGHRAIKKRLEILYDETNQSLKQDPEIMHELAIANPESVSLSKYLRRSGCFPVYKNTKVKYFPLGEDKFEELLKQLEKAEHFIFLEYFIVAEGLMWGNVLDILARKVREGVDVRIMYDGTCEFSTLPHDYPKRLQKLGIKCKMFSPVTPFISTHYNYRDHRKILVIDGHTAFTGGINLADEYINKSVRFGHWKDTAVMLQGEAARSFTLMFLQMWNIDEKVPEIEKFIRCYPVPENQCRGFVIPYADSPLDNKKTGEMVYIDILNRAQKYVHVMSPYLILDGEMEMAIKFAAERGVDVSIILPGIPDKIAPYALAKTHYKSLLDSGVKIYEYTPGFVHAKVFVSDDVKAVVGTINLDYRSLYHHFECAAYMYGTECIDDIEKDFLDTVSKCRPVTYETIKKEKIGYKILGILMKAVAPLM